MSPAGGRWEVAPHGEEEQEVQEGQEGQEEVTLCPIWTCSCPRAATAPGTGNRAARPHRRPDRPLSRARHLTRGSSHARVQETVSVYAVPPRVPVATMVLVPRASVTD